MSLPEERTRETGLYDSETDERIRDASPEETAASDAAALADPNEAGIFVSEGRPVYVIHEYPKTMGESKR